MKSYCMKSYCMKSNCMKSYCMKYRYEISLFRFDGEKLEPIALTKCNHNYSFGLANYRGSALTTGSRWGSSACNVKTEIYEFENGQWNDAPDYPYARFSVGG